MTYLLKYLCLYSFLGVVLTLPNLAFASPGQQTTETSVDDDELSFEGDEMSFGDDELSMDEDSFGFDEAAESEDLLTTWFSKPSRITLMHEVSYKVKKPTGLVNNRSSVRFEYDKYFLEDFYVRFDGKVSSYWGADHQFVVRDHKTLVKEAFLQGSFGNTSIKLGRQMLIWGESEGGAITDVVSPRNLSELFFINLEESRIGQNMINVDHFTDSGDWSIFYAPQAKLNLLPEPGSAYYVDIFNGMAQFDPVDIDGEEEYGIRYKRTWGKSDVAIMAASLIDNNSMSMQQPTPNNQPMRFSQVAGRQKMLGVTFNYPIGNFLISGELANKTDKLFSGPQNLLHKRDVIDSALVVEYSINGNDIIGFEWVNSHVSDHDQNIPFTPPNSHSLIFNYLGFFANEDFMVNWLSILSSPHKSALHSIYTTYKFDDNLSIDINAHMLANSDNRSQVYFFRDQRQLAFKIKYKF